MGMKGSLAVELVLEEKGQDLVGVSYLHNVEPSSVGAYCLAPCRGCLGKEERMES